MAFNGTLTAGFNNFRQWFVTITGTKNGDVSPAFVLRGYTNATMTVSGTFGVGGAITVQGSNDGLTFENMEVYDMTTNANVSTITAAGNYALGSLSGAIPAYLQLAVTAGDGTTSLNAAIVVQGAHP